MKFCANLSFMYTAAESLEARYVLAKKDGFKGVEGGNVYDCPIDDLIEAKMETGLHHILINMPNGKDTDEFGCGALIEDGTIFEENLNTALKYAKALNCNLVHIKSGRDMSGSSKIDRFYEERIRQASDFLGDKNNITCLIEPINNWTVKDYYLNNYERALEVIKKIDSPFLKLQLDIFHLQHIKGNLTRNIEDFMPYVGHIQVAQVPSRCDPHTTGEIDYKYIFDIIKKNGYNGWIGCEYTPMSERPYWIENFGLAN